ncbi:MAG: DUF2164 domain-containing protein [Clostridiaceae bacterium]|nr:DUF2164 domain-containing protein [Eubacteriales bacterium]
MARSDKERIRLSREKKAEMAAALKGYFLSEREEELGDLAANLLLDFISKELGPAFYNEGVADANRYMQERVEDMLALQL